MFAVLITLLVSMSIISAFMPARSMLSGRSTQVLFAEEISSEPSPSKSQTSKGFGKAKPVEKIGEYSST
jgi:hypothetical protein